MSENDILTFAFVLQNAWFKPFVVVMQLDDRQTQYNKEFPLTSVVVQSYWVKI